MMFFVFLLSSVFSASDPKVTYISCWYNSDDNITYELKLDATADAWAMFNDSYSSVGWGQVHIWTNPKSESYKQMYCAGFADTFLTKSRVAEYFYLYKEAQINDRNGQWPEKWTTWFSSNIEYMRQMTKSPSDDYWERTRLIMAQYDGMVKGYEKARTESDPVISELDFWILQSAGDLDDLTEVLAGKPVRDPELTLKCTGMVFLENDENGNVNDIYFAQDTWSDYRDLHAYLKEYNLNIPEFTAHRVTISTRTGHLASVDDFWTNDKGLLVLETTMHNFNHTLYDLYVKPQSILTWIRSYHAMFATQDGKSWTEHFIRENSGTYNNEYLVLDTKKFTKGKPLQNDTLWMIEQYPGDNSMSKDMTQELIDQTYWPSINTPWFPELFELANYTGTQKADPQKANFWSYYDQPRMKVIQHHAKDVTSYEAFQSYMRYNDYKNDPDLQIPYLDGSGTWSEPAQGILSRYDLRPDEGTPYGAKNHFGGLDTKTARVSSFLANQTWDAILSPENKYNPPFNFDDWPEISHDGITNTWKYDWIQFSEIDYCRLFDGNENKDTCLDIPGCGFCIYSQKCAFGEKSGPSESFNFKCEDGWTVKTENPSYTIPLVASVTAIIVIFVCIVVVLHFVQLKKEDKEKALNTYSQLG